MKNRIIKSLLLVFAVTALVGCSSNASEESGKPEKIVLDYAYYSPVSLVLKEKKWVEELFEAEGIEVDYVLSQGGNKAIEFLNSKSADFGSAAGGAAFLAKAKGSPIEVVYNFSKPEWIALVAIDPTIQTVKDLKGKKIAATIGTDMHTFLLRALEDNGLSEKDVEVINLLPGDGATAILTGEVDAWAGLDPHMARVEKEANARLIFRNVNYNTYGTLSVRQDFAEKYPEYVTKVIGVYEKARKWVIENPEETTEILAREAKIDIEIAKIQMSRNDFSVSKPVEEQKDSVISAGELLKVKKIIDPKTDVKKVVDELINPKYFGEY
ncbi:aliphatic sulfonate ABC transporter substrate-binding protein [Sporosarcina sp. FA9]|uniref:aliphatic sulfonate ABC transporter substrate-binding protein n=1 Tax=Sporosarcina sp. FA9 TaxID=3413030 RepID=UPI003F659AEB